MTKMISLNDQVASQRSMLQEEKDEFLPLLDMARTKTMWRRGERQRIRDLQANLRTVQDLIVQTKEAGDYYQSQDLCIKCAELDAEIRAIERVLKDEYSK